jgi:hypothetical protein
VDRATALVAGDLGKLHASLPKIAGIMRLLPPMLGADRPKSYFVAFQNDAEARGTGGLPGAFAILTADHGRLSFGQFSADTVLQGASSEVAFGGGYQRLYGNAATQTMYVNSNLSPNFPDAARIWASMWQRKTGRQVDGAFALDPTALSYLLAVAGPAQLSDGSQVDAGNVVTLTENTSYLRFGDDVLARKQFLIEVARAVAAKVTAARGANTGLVKALARAAGEHRLLLWSAVPDLQAQIAPTEVSGAVPATPEPYAGLTIVNEAGNKLDYYLDRSLTWQAIGCGRARGVTATVTLTNTVPAEVTSPQIVSRYDHHAYPVRPGDSRVTVYFLGTADGVLRSAELDGASITFGSGHAWGHPVFTFDVELPARRPRTLVLHLVEPGGADSPIVPRQPLVRPLNVSVLNARCPGEGRSVGE